MLLIVWSNLYYIFLDLFEYELQYKFPVQDNEEKEFTLSGGKLSANNVIVWEDCERTMEMTERVLQKLCLSNTTLQVMV